MQAQSNLFDHNNPTTATCRTLTQEAKRILEDEIAIAGSFLPLPESLESSLPASTSATPSPKSESQSPEIRTPTQETEVANPKSEQISSLINEVSREPWSRLLSLIPPDSPLHELTTLEQIAEYVANTILVPIDETRINPVPGVGNPNADLMVIGEAPGAGRRQKGGTVRGTCRAAA